MGVLLWVILVIIMKKSHKIMVLKLLFNNCICYFLVFYSEGGPDCFANKKEAIEHCVNKSFGKYNFNDGKNVSIALPLFKFEEPQCKYVWKKGSFTLSLINIT